MAMPPSPALQAMIDAYRSADAKLKENIGKQQTLEAQLTENNMVASELAAVQEGEPVYKLQGKILVLHDVTEAKATVGQRITMIQGEMCVVGAPARWPSSHAPLTARAHARSPLSYPHHPSTPPVKSWAS